MTTAPCISIPDKVRDIVFRLLRTRHTEEELAWQVPELLAQDITVRSLAILEPITEEPLDIPGLIRQAVDEFKKAGGRLRTWESEGLLFH
jgi:hypothetical protein